MHRSESEPIASSNGQNQGVYDQPDNTSEDVFGRSGNCQETSDDLDSSTDEVTHAFYAYC